MWPSNNIVCKITKTNYCTSNYFTKSNVSHCEPETSTAFCCEMWPSNNIVCKITKTNYCTSNYFTKSNLSVTVSQRHIDTCRKSSSTILWESGSKSAGEPNPRLGVRGFGSQHSTYRRHHSRGDRIQSKWRDPNPRGIQIRAYNVGSSKSASVFG